MCLSIVDETYLEPFYYPSIGQGWKVLRYPSPRNLKRFTGPYFHDTEYDFGVWHAAMMRLVPCGRTAGLLSLDCDSYWSGFHIFTSEISANSYRSDCVQTFLNHSKEFIVVHVQWRGLLARGKTFIQSAFDDSYLPTIVAAEMKVDAPETKEKE